MVFQPVVILFMLLLSSCVIGSGNYYTQTVEGWRGGRVCALVDRWGIPYKKIMAANGATVYVYKTKSYHPTPSPVAIREDFSLGKNERPSIMSTPNVNSTWSRGDSYSCISAFQANKAGVIVGTQTHGSGCYGSASFAETMGNPDLIKS